MKVQEKIMDWNLLMRNFSAKHIFCCLHHRCTIQNIKAAMALNATPLSMETIQPIFWAEKNLLLAKTKPLFYLPDLKSPMPEDCGTRLLILPQAMQLVKL